MKFTIYEIRAAIISVLTSMSDREIECSSRAELADKIAAHLLRKKFDKEVTK